ncbi:hypothetical protein KRP22_009835 [Phytophthora ramorum]|uniref:uncharacterized protein n=1 Tax=Phytophthora ramorum TaxID=164328 RepID=UPI0030AD0920|nr:hypothetical protein KRP23_5338 [Phytophthora ramorum]KAH7495629.1 hypothetical protein KRP22_14781 [Phytophthora ramorum]
MVAKLGSKEGEAQDESLKFCEGRELPPRYMKYVTMAKGMTLLLLVEVRFQEWSSGIAELREYVAANGLVGSLVAVLVKMIKRQEQDAVCIVQVIEHLCFEAGGEPSQVFDELTELLLGYCCENKDACVATWLLRALNGITRGLRQYEQRYGMASRNQHKLWGLMGVSSELSSTDEGLVCFKDGSTAQTLCISFSLFFNHLR